jgi:hypothetical protein
LDHSLKEASQMLEHFQPTWQHRSTESQSYFRLLLVRAPS